MIYLYVTPSGSVNLIEGEKMPTEPKTERGTSENVFIPYNMTIDAKKWVEYDKALDSAKASSVPVDPESIKSDWLWRIVFPDLKQATFFSLEKQTLYYRIGNQHYIRSINPTELYGPFGIEYEIKEACAHESCPVDAGCEHCKEPIKVAILLPATYKINEDFLGTPEYDDDPPIKRNAEPVGKLEEKEDQDALKIFTDHRKMNWDHEWAEDGVINFTEFKKIWDTQVLPLQSENTRRCNKINTVIADLHDANEKIERLQEELDYWKKHGTLPSMRD